MIFGGFVLFGEVARREILSELGPSPSPSELFAHYHMDIRSIARYVSCVGRVIFSKFKTTMATCCIGNTPTVHWLLLMSDREGYKSISLTPQGDLSNKFFLLLVSNEEHVISSLVEATFRG